VYNQTCAPTTIWNRSLSVVQFKGTQVKVKNLVAGVQSMFEALTRKMHDLSGGKPIKHSIPSEHVDDLSSTGRGKSWTQAAYTEPRDHALMHSMVLQDLWNLSSVDDNGHLVWNKIACRDFMRKAADIVDLIITLVHIGSGPPLRGEEIVRDQISNGIQPRTIYLAFGQIIAIRRHSKDTNAKGMDPFNVCYFPQNLTDAICYYILVIRPLERLIAHHLYQDEIAVQTYDLFLYVKHGKRMTSTQFSTTLERTTSEHIGVGLSLHPLRHILIAFQRAYVEELRVHRGDNIGDLISSHTSKTADAHYAIEHGQPEGLIASHLLNVQEWCDSYHDAIGLGDRTVPLVPLRVSRRRARQLSSVLSTAGSRDPLGKVESLLPLIKELTTTAYKSAMEDLKPFVSRELRSANAEAMEYMLTAQSISEQPRGNTFAAPEPPGTRPTKGLPSRAPSQQPLQPAMSSESNANRRFKRVLSSGEQSQAKRKSLAPDDPSTRIPANPDDEIPSTRFEEDFDFPMLDDGEGNLEATSTPGPATIPRIPDQQAPELKTPFIIPANLPTPEVVEEESTTLARFSSMHLGPHQAEEGQIPSQTIDQASSRATGVESNDPTLRALQRLRRDPLAKFKSPEQRQLVDSVLSGRHTIGVLPTGGGKSLAYELPPVCQGQLTIAAFPFKVITSQAAQNCIDRGVGFQRWVSKDPRFIDEERLIIMAIETLLSAEMLE